MLDLTTPSLLFSAISLILLAYTNRFLSYASVVRALKEKHQQTHDPKDIAQIANLRKRLYLTRSMQILGILSLLLCVIAMFFIYVSWQIFAAWIFGIALLLLAASVIKCCWLLQLVHTSNVNNSVNRCFLFIKRICMFAKSNDSMRDRKILEQFVRKICFSIERINLVFL